MRATSKYAEGVDISANDVASGLRPRLNINYTRQPNAENTGRRVDIVEDDLH